MFDPKELASLDAELDMTLTIAKLKEAIGTLPRAGAMTGDQRTALDLIVKKMGEAESYFERPVDDPDVYEGLLAVAKVAGRDDLVKEFGRRVATIEARGLYFEAYLQAFFGASTRAVELYSKAVSLVPDYDEAKDGLGKAQARVTKAKSKLQSLKARADSSKTDPKAWTDLGTALLDLDQPDQALACFNNAAKLAPGDVNVMCKRASALAILGKVDEANGIFRTALGAQPTSLNAKRGLNYTNYLTGKHG
jgi:tetratricopeptide (TPR) repeat protein